MFRTRLSKDWARVGDGRCTGSRATASIWRWCCWWWMRRRSSLGAIGRTLSTHANLTRQWTAPMGNWYLSRLKDNKKLNLIPIPVNSSATLSVLTKSLIVINCATVRVAFQAVSSNANSKARSSNFYLRSRVDHDVRFDVSGLVSAMPDTEAPVDVPHPIPPGSLDDLDLVLQHQSDHRSPPSLVRRAGRCAAGCFLRLLHVPNFIWKLSWW